MDISEAAARPFFYIRGPLFYPSLIEKVIESALSDGDDHHITFPLHADEGFSAGFSSEQKTDVFACGDIFSVDAGDDIAFFDIIAFEVERTVPEHFGYFQTVTGIGEVIEQPQGSRGFRFELGTVGRSGVGHVEFSEPLAEEDGEIVIVADMGEKTAVCGRICIPVHSMHILIVEPFLFFAIDVIEHIFPLRRMVDM